MLLQKTFVPLHGTTETKKLPPGFEPGNLLYDHKGTYNRNRDKAIYAARGKICYY